MDIAKYIRETQKKSFKERKFYGIFRNLFAHVMQAVDTRKLPTKDGKRGNPGCLPRGVPGMFAWNNALPPTDQAALSGRVVFGSPVCDTEGSHKWWRESLGLVRTPPDFHLSTNAPGAWRLSFPPLIVIDGKLPSLYTRVESHPCR